MSGSVVVIVVICRFGCVEKLEDVMIASLLSINVVFAVYEVAVVLNPIRLGAEN